MAKHKKSSVYKGGKKAQGKTNSKIPTGPNKRSARSKRVRKARKTGRTV